MEKAMIHWPSLIFLACAITLTYGWIDRLVSYAANKGSKRHGFVDAFMILTWVLFAWSQGIFALSP